jgi:hypothetical protein
MNKILKKINKIIDDNEIIVGNKRNIISDDSEYDNDRIIEIKEKELEELNKSIEIKKINEHISKRKNKLNRISDLVNLKFDLKNNNNNTKKSYSEIILKNKQIFEDKIRQTHTFSSNELSVLLSLYIYILYKTHDLKLLNDFTIFYNKYNKYKSVINIFIEKNNYSKQHNYLLLLLNNYIKNKKLIDYNSIVIEHFDKKLLSCYNIKSYNELKIDISIMLQSLEELSLSLLLNINNDNSINNKEKKIELINIFTLKFAKIFDIGCVYNNPELCIFNSLVNFSKINEPIIFITIHFVLPVSYIKSLIADFFIMLKINNKLQFCVIEYDGPTHYNILDHRISIDHIKRDIIKNNFCINNNISIIRVFDKDKNYINTIIEFIQSIISNNGKPIFKIPDDTYYNTLLENLTNHVQNQ